MTNAPISSQRERALCVLLGIVFGAALVKGEAVSWWRIHEMFRGESPKLYLTLGSAVVTAFVGMQLLRRFGIRTMMDGESICVPAKHLGAGTRYWAGGTIFGIGWAVAGMCPGPLFAVVGAGGVTFLLAIAAAMIGSYAYAWLRPYLPH